MKKQKEIIIIGYNQNKDFLNHILYYIICPFSAFQNDLVFSTKDIFRDIDLDGLIL